ncbi:MULTISPECIES: hypothetical protein [unclassified Paraburkholderia]|uniref:hypothetical protein n=1 Tax=unclassified Paraburkholderia TaxID=2615204 RepID=UPI002AB31926|nr:MULTISPECIES: hypothetical protein [unclassified Paraburkholderia]
MQQPIPSDTTEVLPASPHHAATGLTEIAVNSPFGELPHLAPKIVALPGENPAFRSLPNFSNAMQARRAIEHVPDIASGYLSVDEQIILGTPVLGSLILDLTASARASAYERNLASEQFRAKVMTAHQVALQRERNRCSPVPATVALPGVPAKVHFAVVGHGLGQRALIHACQRVFGKSNRAVDVPVADGGGWIRFFRMDTLVHEFPSSGSARAFYLALARKVDGVLLTGFRYGRFSSSKISDEEATVATQAMLLSINLGVLIIGPVSTRESDPTRAAAVWSLLATVAAETGIPVLIVATAGAAVNLIEHSGAQPDLSRGGVYDIAPFGMSSKAWRNVALMLWMKYLRAFAETPPEWFYSAIWAQTLGRIELAVKVAAHIGRAWASSNFVCTSLTKTKFKEQAHTALALEAPRLGAIRSALRGGNFSRAQVMRNADWLPLQMVIESLPSLDAPDDWFAKKHYQSNRLVKAKTSLSVERDNAAGHNASSQVSGAAS